MNQFITKSLTWTFEWDGVPDPEQVDLTQFKIALVKAGCDFQELAFINGTYCGSDDVENFVERCYKEGLVNDETFEHMQNGERQLNARYILNKVRS
jgi:hypothetical protein